MDGQIPSNKGFCIYCGRPMAPEYKFCASCGRSSAPASVGSRRKRAPLVALLGFGLLIVVVVTIAVNDRTPAPHPPEANAPPTAGPPTDSRYPHFGDGMHIVGRDVQPGTYRTRSASNGCYHARLSGFEGSMNQILANENTDAPAVVTIGPTDRGFKSSRCGTWTQNLSPITGGRGTFGDGVFIVGTDIDPGTYRSTGQGGCYYARLASFSGAMADILANENSDSPAIVTIAPTDKGFRSSRCGIWTRVTENEKTSPPASASSAGLSGNPTSSVAEEPTPPHSGESVTAYMLFKNPYQERGKLVDLDPRVWPLLFGGRVQTYSVNGPRSRQLGYSGIVFSRMIDEDVALFDIQYMDAEGSGGPGLSTAGRLAVMVPPTERTPSTDEIWIAEPMGVMEGTNGFGAPIKIPLIKFFGYKRNQPVGKDN